MTAGKKAQTATKVARKNVPTAAAGKPSTSTSEQDPDYEPYAGGPWPVLPLGVSQV